MLCSIEGCPYPSRKRGWCGSHYQRWFQTGSVGAELPIRARGRSTAERFWEKVDKSGGENACWPWTGTTDQGYAVFVLSVTPRKLVRAHRWVYEAVVGPIPDGLTVDHTCHNSDLECKGGFDCPHRKCVNPAHLDPCTKGENSLRSPNTISKQKARWTHCKRGHEFTPENTIPIRGGRGRSCRICTNARASASSKRRRREKRA